MMITSRARRRLARITMLFGYVFNITIVSAFINVFLSLKAAEVHSAFTGLLIPLTVIFLMFYFIRNRKVRSMAVSLFERIAGKIIHLDSDNTVLPVDYIGEDSIAVVTLRQVPEEYRDLPASCPLPQPTTFCRCWDSSPARSRRWACYAMRNERCIFTWTAPLWTASSGSIPTTTPPRSGCAPRISSA